MKTILIPTFVKDIHATAVEIQLKKMGHRVIRWFGADFPELSSLAVCGSNFDKSFIQFKEGNENHRISLSEIDIFWNRRHSKPIITAPLLHSDNDIAIQESQSFLHGFFSLISNKSFSVNHYDFARRSESKTMQLMEANSVGFQIPTTLISNDPTEIKSFIANNNTSRTIYKPHKPVMWTSEEKVAICLTNEVTLDKLPNDDILRLTPGIFQERVEKSFEIRVTCMGASIVAVKLNSQSIAEAKLDWRGVSPSKLKIELFELPPEVKLKCLKLLEKLNLVFGCIDLIVTPDYEFIFLEINQMGQFLWIEEYSPEIPLLDMFCQFLISENKEFQYKKSPQCASFLSVRSESIFLSNTDETTHRFEKHAPNVYLEAS